MLKLKFLIVVIMVTSAYMEKDITRWLISNSVNRSVYAHVRLKGRKYRLHKTLVAGTRVKKEKKIDCLVSGV